MERAYFIAQGKNYESPDVEIIEIRVEQGFAQSSQQKPSPWEDLDEIGF
jgi:hypothetical protein